MYRIYSCPKCQYIDYISVSNKQEISKCSLCGHKIRHNSIMVYKKTIEEAERIVKQLVRFQSLSHSSERPIRGLGVKKRVLRMLESLLDLNKERPVAVSDLLTECADAGISQDRTLHFIEVLCSEGIVAYIGNRLKVIEGDGPDI